MTKVEMQEVINKLHLRLSRTAAECVHCHRIFAVDDPAWDEHWRECPSHPARVEREALAKSSDYFCAKVAELDIENQRLQDEVAELRSQLKWMALELDRCRAEKAKANDDKMPDIPNL